ncbi:hypothetical protein GCM10023189_30530 [Nibrella saemangeumensis]|uniref:Uncharacterized protein n=1 Tax=Nibrella saemangeumensis TaxID=1084526 RepID=A0ABP8MYQ7_9BACT
MSYINDFIVGFRGHIPKSTNFSVDKENFAPDRPCFDHLIKRALTNVKNFVYDDDTIQQIWYIAVSLVSVPVSQASPLEYQFPEFNP